MKRNVILSLALAMVFAISSFAVAAGEGWVEDFAKAKAKAAKEGKDLLVDFTGSDWCGWCIKLDKEVFAFDSFKKAAPKDFVLVSLDYPRDKSKLSEKIIAQNDKLKKEYGITGFPTIYLMDAAGKPYARTGYQDGGPEKYIEHLAELQGTRKARDKKFDAAKKIKDKVAKAKMIDSALEEMGLDIASKFYSSEIEEIIALDGKNKAELKSKYETILFETKFDALVKGKKFDDAAALLKATVKSWGLTGNKATEFVDKYEGKIFSSKISGLKRQRKNKEAIELIEARLAKVKLTGEALAELKLQLANTYGTDGQTAKAIKIADEVLKANNYKGEELQYKLLAKANIYQAAKDNDNLYKVLQQAIDAAPDTPMAGNLKNYLAKNKKKD